MRFLRESALVVVALFLFSSFCYAADLNFPYSNFRLKLSPSEDPFPGMGNYYTTLSKGMKSALWNPASLAKLKLSETSFSINSAMEIYNYQRTTSMTETSGDLSISEGGSAAGQYGLFYRTPEEIGSGINTDEVNVTSYANYATESTGINFTSALKVNEWLAVGFSANNPIEFSMDLAGDFPLTTKALTNLYDQTLSEMQVNSEGKLQYTFSSGGSTTTYESTQALWSGFLSQEATLPFTSLSEFRNNMNVHSPYTGTLASKLGNLSVGCNMIPINATANFENDFRAIINDGTDDIYIYTPDFDSSNQTELASWINDPDKYGTSAGYRRKTLRLPEGEIIATAKYKGYYSASTARVDIGGMYDLTDWLTVGVALENSTGSALNFKGNGLASYVSYREINTSEAGSMEELLQPGGQTSYDLITNTWITTDEVGSKLMLEPEKNYALPKRMRAGIALKKPFLIAIDFEQNQTPISYITTDGSGTAKEITISNINLVRIGTETQFLFFPLWLRSGLTLIAKPTITGLSAAEQQSIDSAFQYGYLPLKFDFGTDMNTWGILSGTSFGVNAQSILSILQFDSTNIDLSKMVYANTFIGKDPWQISYLMSADPLATASAYGTKSVPVGEEKSFEVSDLKFVQTLGVTYRF